MANPSSVDNIPCTLVCSICSGMNTVTVNSARAYTLAHDSLNEANVADTNIIYVATSGNPLTTGQANGNTVKLIGGRSIILGPGVSSINFTSTAGTPTFALINSELSYGKI